MSPLRGEKNTENRVFKPNFQVLGSWPTSFPDQGQIWHESGHDCGVVCHAKFHI